MTLFLFTMFSLCMQFDIPQWVIDLRHEASHSDLPSVGRLRAGATFCLRWLKHYYWRQYREICAIQRVESRATTPELGASHQPCPLLAQQEEVPGADVEVVATRTTEGGVVWKLTRGLCNSKFELVDLLTSSTYG